MKRAEIGIEVGRKYGYERVARPNKVVEWSWKGRKGHGRAERNKQGREKKK